MNSIGEKGRGEGFLYTDIALYKKEDIVYVDESGIDRHLHR
jgi:hypothetical protein